MSEVISHYPTEAGTNAEFFCGNGYWCRSHLTLDKHLVGKHQADPNSARVKTASVVIEDDWLKPFLT